MGKKAQERFTNSKSIFSFFRKANNLTFMTRKKVKLAYIANDSARKATFKKRKKGLMKKVRELSTLCGVEACAILYSPYDSMPEVWPDQVGVQRVLTRFKGMSEMDQSKKMVNQESFLRQRIVKANEQLKKQCKDNREKEVTEVMYQSLVGRGLHGLTMMDLNDLGWLVEQNIKEVQRKLETLNNEPSNQPKKPNSSNALVITSEMGGGAVVEKSDTSGGQNDVLERSSYEVNNNMVETMQRQQWFMDFMNPHEHVGFGGGGGDEIIFPFSDDNNNNNNALWPNIANFFP